MYTIRWQLKTFLVCDSSKAKSKGVRRQLRSLGEVVPLARAIYKTLDADREHFTALYLTTKNHIVGFKVIATGTLTASLVHPREAYLGAFDPSLKCAALIFIHNHPGGDPAPSPEDREITQRLKEVADLLGLRLLDHIILGRVRHYSFQERGTL